MTRSTRLRYVVGAALGALTVLLSVYGIAVVWGLSVEYAAGLQVLPLTVLVPTLVGAIALQVWPGLRTRTTALATLGLAALLLAGGLVAHPIGMAEREERALEASARIGCNGPNTEVQVDPRVDEVFAELPRPTRLYGPVEGTRHGCGAGVAGGEEAFDSWATALRDLDGWRVIHDEPEVLAVRRDDGITIVLERGDVPVLSVSTAEGTDLGHNSGEFVSGTNRSHG
jgi:hypothetical protein